MRKVLVYLCGLAVVLLTSCEQKDLSWCPPEGDAPVNLVIHWDEATARANGRAIQMPSLMTVYWYPKVGAPLISDMSAHGGSDYLARDVYEPIIIDYYGNATLDARRTEQRSTFEVYNIAKQGLYNSQVPQLPGGETTVAEAYPYQWWVAGKAYTREHRDTNAINVDTLIDTRDLPIDSVLTAHAYPKNALREFTFLIFDVKGARWMQTKSGAISGQSAAYYPATGEISQRPATILFNRIEAIPDAQTSTRWTTAQKALFAQKNPDWQSPDSLIGWTGDWVTGTFSTFGPIDVERGQFRLTVDALTSGSNYYAGSWGYYHGSWEDNVGTQIAAALGEHGTWEEQLAWREQNAGFDIIIDNESRLVVPSPGTSQGDGAFNVNIGGWGDMVGVDMSGGNSNSRRIDRRAVPAADASKRAAVMIVDTASLQSLTLNGVWSEDQTSLLFDEQYIYKTELGKWDYSPAKYWYNEGSIDFYAYAPSELVHLTEGMNGQGTNGTPPIITYAMPLRSNDQNPPPGMDEPVTPFGSNEQEDLLVAAQSRDCPQTEAVPINLRHAFSLVSVRAKANNANRLIKVARVDLRNVYTKGKLSLAPDPDDTAPYDISTGIPKEIQHPFIYDPLGVQKVILWQSHETLANYTFRLYSPEVPLNSIDYTMLTNSGDRLFVMPQAAGGAYIHVEYDEYTVNSIGEEQYVASYSQNMALPSGFAFEIGRQYTLNLELNTH